MTTPNAAKTRRERRLEERLARRENPRPRRTETKRRIGLGWLTLLAVVGGLVLVAAAVVLGGDRTPPTAPLTVAAATVPADLPTEGYILGQADAPVTIDLYEDFQCPACQSWGEGVFPRLAANELANGTARLVFHGMAFLGPESTTAARAAYAAGEQGRFWDMWATIYANQGRENSGALGRERLVAMAEKLGLDLTTFEADMESAAADANLSTWIGEADAAGVSSTPTVVIAGQPFVGVQPYPDIAAAIAAAAGAAE
jgi:protein-disulfide isomerase